MFIMHNVIDRKKLRYGPNCSTPSLVNIIIQINTEFFFIREIAIMCDNLNIIDNYHLVNS